MIAPLASANTRPGLVIVSNEQTPYRIHFHRRIVHEIPELELFSFFTHEVASSPWLYEDVAEINPILIGTGEKSSAQSKLTSAPREWTKGGQIIGWMSQRDIAAVVVLGYNDVGRLRIIRWCKKQRIPCFLFGDSNVRGDTRRRWLRLLKRAILPAIIRSCSGVLCCGALGREYFLRYGAQPDSIRLMPYEPAYDEIRNVSADAVLTVRRAYNLSEDRRYILFVGRIEQTKRPDLLLHAFEQIADHRPDWDLLFVGDGSLRESLQSSVPARLASRVKWTGFIANPVTIYALYASCDLFVLPSDYEPWGVVITEAAVHLPIIASTAVGAAHELVNDGVNGKFFIPGDLDGISGSLLYGTDATRASHMRSKSRETLGQWRRTADPIRGLRQALQSANALSASTAPRCV